MFSQEVPYSDVEVGKQYIYEESLYSEGRDVIIFRTIVSILQDLSSNDYWNYVLRIDKWIDGVCEELPSGYKFESGVSKKIMQDRNIDKICGNRFYSISKKVKHGL